MLSCSCNTWPWSSRGFALGERGPEGTQTHPRKAWAPAELGVVVCSGIIEH